MKNEIAKRRLLLGSAVVLCSAIGVAWAAGPTIKRARSTQKPPEFANLVPAAAARPTRGAYMVELNDEPTVTTFNRVRPVSGHPAAVTAVAEQASKIETEQQRVLGELAAFPVQVIYRIHRVYNGIAVIASRDEIAKLSKIAGVKGVHMIPNVYPTNAVTVPLIKAPDAWQSTGLTGNGIKIGVIDTGVDYLHTDFGGPGLTDAGDTAVANPYFPSAKVVGGWDFAGDAYDAVASPIPVPDPNPMDCNGHGSHTSGTATGYGVNADGGTYTGVYSTATPFDSLKIGPGVAPNAQLYALRVFGCAGSTNLVPQAIDWAVDPTNSGDFSHHLDVISMSLGSGYGPSDDPSAAAAERAASLGVIVVAASGNDGDVYYVTSSPGSSTRTISVAASADSTDYFDGFAVTAPAAIAGVYISSDSSAFSWSTFAGVTSSLYYPGSSTNKDGCDPFAGTDMTNIAGHVVLVDWDSDNSTRRCGSKTRSDNAHNAGAVGIIMGENIPTIDTGILGDAFIPATITTSDVAATLKAHLTAGVLSSVTVHLDKSFILTGKLVTPGKTDTLASFSSRGPRVGNALKPDITGPGVSVLSVLSRSGSNGTVESGTSMATPHIAGTMSLLKELHPTWSVEELKALAMNTATHDLYTGQSQTGQRYATSRTGAGRVDVLNATQSSVIAYSADIPGAVGVSFGAVEVANSVTLTRHITISNKGTAPASLSVSYLDSVDIPGVTFGFPNSGAITVPPGQTLDFPVLMTANAALMTNTVDPTVAPTQVGFPRQFISEKSGFVVLTPTSGPTLRVPLYVTARPASVMSGSLAPVAPGAVVQTQIALTGQGLDTSGGAHNYPTDLTSLVTALELQGVSPRLTFGLDGGPPPSAAADDLQYIGVTTDAPSLVDAGQPITSATVFFGISTYSPWSTPGAEVSFHINIDVNNDGVFDLTLQNTSASSASVLASDVFVTALGPCCDVAPVQLESLTNVFDAQSQPTAPMNSDVLIMPVPFADLGVTGTRFNYQVVAEDPYYGTIDTSDTFTYDIANPGIDVTGGAAVSTFPMYVDAPGGSIPVAINTAAFNANKSLGILLLHHFNTAGNRAQIVRMDNRPFVGTLSVTPNPVPEGSAFNGSATFADLDGGAGSWKADVDFNYSASAGTFNVGTTVPVTAQGTVSFTGTYNTPGAKTVGLRVVNAGGGASDVVTAPITVTNVAPTLAGLAGPASLTVGQKGTFTSSFTDPGNDSPWNAVIDYNYDGKSVNNGDSTQLTATGPISFIHAYDSDGVYTVAVQVTDSVSGASNIQTLSVNVKKSGCGCQSSGVELSGAALIALVGLARRKRWGFLSRK